MTKLSININKIALLRNSRGRNFPDVFAFAERCLSLGAHGITLHPRPDQRHARYSDIRPLRDLCDAHAGELNVEGYPSPEFIEAVINIAPAQCTLVPDSPLQLTSDHGWEIRKNQAQLAQTIQLLKAANIRVSVFMDFESSDIALAKAIGADRIELYTEPYAHAFDANTHHAILNNFKLAATSAQHVGLGVNAGHDLSLQNLATFLQIPNILEVSIGHAFVVECINQGLEAVMRQYLSIIDDAR